MVQLKMRPIFSRGNSVASFSVATGKEHDAPLSPQSPQQQAPIRRRRVINAHVSFSEHVTEYPAGEPLSEKELKAYFYSSDDLKRFNRDRALTALMYRSGKHPNGGDGAWDDNVHSIRGLEDVVRKDYCTAERERRDHVIGILNEQARLKTEGKGLDALSLYGVSSKSSCAARQEALDRGKEDALALGRFESDSTSTLLQMVRGKLYSLMEKQPSFRSLGST